MNMLFALMVLAVLVVLYFVPTIVAASRKHLNAGPIALVNMFFGWTLLGWLIALIWSASSHVEGQAGPQVIYVYQQVPQAAVDSTRVAPPPALRG